MKIRNGFVSNSSSSSFIIKNETEKAKAIAKGMDLYKVSDMLELMKDIQVKSEKIKGDMSEEKFFPFFISNEFYCMDIPYYEELLKIEKKYPGCYITSEFDRDVAYVDGIEFEVFQGDL